MVPAHRLSAVVSDDVLGTTTMTKATGTLLWMAPEVFRGDTRYGSESDVYSFGIVMWELATRQLPWAELRSSDSADFFTGLNRALQLGQRPLIPPDIEAEQHRFVSLMRECWASNPSDRPLFADTIVPRLAKLLSDMCALKADHLAPTPVAPSGSEISGVSDSSMRPHRDSDADHKITTGSTGISSSTSHHIHHISVSPEYD